MTDTTAQALESREAHLARLTELFHGRHGRHVFVLCGANWPVDVDVMVDPEAWVRDQLAGCANAEAAAADPTVFRPLSLEPWIYGVHFVDSLFGGRVFYHQDENSRGWWCHYLEQPVGLLQAPDLTQAAPWLKAQALAQAILASGARLPFFGTQVLASPLNIAINLYGEEFLVALAAEPEAAARDLATITACQADLHRWYQATLPAAQFQPVVAGGRCQPRGFGQICGCSTQLVAPEQYRDLIAPHDAALLRLYPHGGMIHLCGGHTQHIPCWRAMPELRAVQLNDRAADDLELYVNGLRDDQILYWSPTAHTDVKRAMEITGGRRLVLCADVREPLPVRQPPARLTV